MKILLATLLLGFAALAVNAQGSFAPEPAIPVVDTDGIEELYLAKDNGKGKAGPAATSFLTTDVPIFCVVQLDSLRAVTVKLILVAVDVPGVDAETKVVAVSYKTDGMQDRVNFEGKPKGNWVAGKYRADIYIDDVLANNVEFDITKAAAKIKSRNGFQQKKEFRSITGRYPNKR